MNLVRMLLAVVIATSIATSADAQDLKKCVDANGKITYSDQPCAGSSVNMSVRITTAASSTPSSQNAGTAVSENMRILYACEQGKKEACFNKETIEKRCSLQRKRGTGALYSDCVAYEGDRSKFRELLGACTRDKREDACATLSCVGGDSNSCNRSKEEKEKNQNKLEKRIVTAVKQGLPSGSGWFMSQDWMPSGDGGQSAIVTCSATSSVALRKKPPMTHRIFTTVTGEEYFTTVEEAAKKACGKI